MCVSTKQVTHKAVSSRLPGTSVSDHYGLLDVAIDLQVLYKDDGDVGEPDGEDDEDGYLEVLPQRLICRVIGQPSHEQLCPCCVALLDWLKYLIELFLNCVISCVRKKSLKLRHKVVSNQQPDNFHDITVFS